LSRAARFAVMLHFGSNAQKMGMCSRWQHARGGQSGALLRDCCPSRGAQWTYSRRTALS
jgi:hypothetical protein